MIFLDTHVVLWLYEGLTDKFSKKNKELIEANGCFISPMVALELEYLHEIKRSKVKANDIISELEQTIDLATYDTKFKLVTTIAQNLTWSSDPYDRLIVATAKLEDTLLLTKDKTIHKHYAKSV